MDQILIENFKILTIASISPWQINTGITSLFAFLLSRAGKRRCKGTHEPHVKHPPNTRSLVKAHKNINKNYVEIRDFDIQFNVLRLDLKNIKAVKFKLAYYKICHRATH